MIFEALQSELFRFKFHLLGSKILKFPEFNLTIVYLFLSEMRLGSLLIATTATTTVAGRVIQIQENLSDKSISIGSFRHKQPQNSHHHRMPNRLSSSREPTDR